MCYLIVNGFAQSVEYILRYATLPFRLGN